VEQRAQQIRQALEASFHPVELNIIDESWKHAGHAGAMEQGGGHFVVEIVSDQFAGKSRIECQRMVNHALKTLYGPVIHALTIDAKPPTNGN
jgi:BolA protein